jgi:hypothetical protein
MAPLALLLPLAALLRLSSASAFVGHSHYNTYRHYGYFRHAGRPPHWEKDWQQVSDVSDVPPARAEVAWGRLRVQPNITIAAGDITERPRMSWPYEHGALYTVLITDAWSDRVLPKPFIFWTVTNIPGNQVEMGTEVFDYVTPWSIVPKADGTFETDPLKSAHPILVLVFKQPGWMGMEEGQRGCTPDFLPKRIHYFKDLVTKYGLTLAAGNFFQNPYSGLANEQMLCRFTKCSAGGEPGKPFPFLIPNVNDLPECRGRTDIIDFTAVGPVLAKRGLFAKYRSLLSRDSITTQIRDLKSQGLSTGVIKDFTTIDGAFNGAPLGSNNLPQTLEGVVDVTFLQYPTQEATFELFERAGELFPSIPALFSQTEPLVAGGRALKIIMSRPQDQDFDFMTIIENPGMVIQLNVVKVKEGKEDEFQRLRDEIQTRSRSSKNIVNIFKFDVDQEILEREKGGGLYFDSSNNEISIGVYDSYAARNRFLQELAGADPALITAFQDTFDCIVCAVLTDMLHSSTYPPFPE